MHRLRSIYFSAASYRKIRSDRLRLCILLAVLFSLNPAVQARSVSGRIMGVLKDQKGAVLQGGVVEIRNLESGLMKSTVTNQEGRYVLELLPPGRYRASASFFGFETSVREDVRVTAEQDEVVDFVLSIARKETLVVVTAPTMSKPLVVETDPRAPRQPIPAHDGADYLKAIPGFSVIRKGGTDGDPILRGMAGSRLNILLDGQQILGGCGGRMDPPTAYVYPSAYDRITVLKGPQTVQYGPNASAGTVLFERDRRRAERWGIFLNSALTVGSYGRHDEMIDARAALPNGYVQTVATRSHTDDYRDGNGTAVHSFYTRWSANAELGWTPSSDTYLEMSAAKSDGQAAYADRTMDGSKFARENMAVRFDKRHISSLLDRVEASWYYNYIDHVMDNFSLRTPGSMYSAMNPDRITAGGRAAVTLVPGKKTTVDVGLDTQRNVHRSRGSMGAMSASLATMMYQSAPRAEDMRFNQLGLFAEATRILTRRSRLIGGFRNDWQKAVDSRMCVNASMCPGSSPLKNNTMGATDRKTLWSGFGRYELDVKGGSGTLYAGLGHTERFPDYWERLKQDPITLRSAFLTTRPEKTSQMDVGMLWRSDTWMGSVSGFYGKVHDYILIRWMPTPTLTRNIDATIMGAEADMAKTIVRDLKAEATLAYVRANNETDRKPLAQQPPLEGTVGMTYDNHVFTIGALARLVGAQNRIDVGSGNIVANGMDIGRTAGFGVFSLNGGCRLKGFLLITGGVDNLLDKAYAEHLSKSGAAVPGFLQMFRINEPGRTFWLKANINVD
ncbi:MAG TPA: TonB-dependent copper receptor [Acidobacteriota bacterium]|nr:TonB-dependent copper receptor [Acidobacteriota bacterium]